MSPWTAWEDPAAESAATALLARLSARIESRWRDRLAAAWLVGGFGRGEGSLLRRGSAYFAWNDVDYALLLRPGAEIPDDAESLAASWALEEGLDSVDLGWVPHGAWRRPRSLFHLEAGRSHRVVLGDDSAARVLPATLAPAEFRTEASRLLLNRGFALILLACEPHRCSAPEQLSFRLNAILKCDMALGDARLLAAGALPATYAARPAALARLGAPEEVRRVHAEAVENKLRPTAEWADRPRDIQGDTRAAAARWLRFGPSAGDLDLGRPLPQEWIELGRTLLGGMRARTQGSGMSLRELERALPALMQGLADPRRWSLGAGASAGRESDLSGWRSVATEYVSHWKGVK